MTTRSFILIAGRTSKQGVQINVGKHNGEYDTIVTVVTMHADDMKELGLAAGAAVRLRSENGSADFTVQEGKVPAGMIFVPYGPPTCKLMTGDTEGTGMPISKGEEVTVELLPTTAAPAKEIPEQGK
jgi:formylmethanofuran dehydrogenase subunit D